jgi:hypothetical protein
MSEYQPTPEKEPYRGFISELSEEELTRIITDEITPREAGDELTRRLKAQGKFWISTMGDDKVNVTIYNERDTSLVSQPSPERPEPAFGELYGKTLEDWHALLTGDNLDVPVSQYGRNAADVAWAAIASIIIYDKYMGEPDDIEAFAEHSMSLVVNDDKEIGRFIVEHLHMLPGEVLQHLDPTEWDL